MKQQVKVLVPSAIGLNIVLLHGGFAISFLKMSTKCQLGLLTDKLGT